MKRRGALASGALAMIGAVALGYATAYDLPIDTPRRADAARLMNELMSGNAAVGGPFTLNDASGRRVSLADFRGKVVVLYFGYTFCPDVCPTDLQAIAAMLDRLGAGRGDVQPIFVTLDPERDQPAQLASYVGAFSPAILALSGSPADTRAVATSYKVFYEKVRQKGSTHYAIDHSAFTFVIDTHGDYAGFFPPGTGPERMAAVVRALIEERKGR